MPEGPEIRRSADVLSRHLVGKRLANAFIGKHGRYTFPGSPPEDFEGFLGEMRGRGAPLITEVNCKGKFMWWQVNFDHRMSGFGRTEDSWYVWITYGMSGQWTPEETPYTAFGIYYGDTMDAAGNFIQPAPLYFNDIRHFGTLKFVNSTKEHVKKLASLGPDMLSAPPTPLDFCSQLAKRKTKTIAEALMDQSVVSGVGNYIKAEALYLAELSPHRLVNSLGAKEAERLRQQIINVMKASYNTGGATFSTYRNP
jgi:DNA-formamidopyrimidine glycosylase